MARYHESSYSSRLNKRGPHKNPWITLLKVLCWCVGILVILGGIALWIFSYYVSPDRITRIIEKESDQYLDASVKIGSLDYKFFKTYPWLQFEVDSVEVISKSLDGLTDADKSLVPLYADSLAFIRKIRGKVNVHSLFHKKINLKDIEIVEPMANIVILNDSLNNFNILKEKPGKFKMPEIEISTVEVVTPVHFNFFSLEEDIEAGVDVGSFSLVRDDNKFYDIAFEGNVSGHYKDYSLPGVMPVEVSTSLYPDYGAPAIKLNKLALSVAGIVIEAKGDMKADSNGIDLNNAGIDVRIEDVFTLLQYLPSQLLEYLTLPEGLSGILPVDLSVNLNSPYKLNYTDFNNLSLENLPGINADVIVENANLSFTPPKGRKIWADDVYVDVSCCYDPLNKEETTLKIKDLRMNGEGINLSGDVEILNLLGENQTIDGSLSFHSPLMESLTYLMPKMSFKIAGLLKGNVEFHGDALNYGKDGFKNIEMKGDFLSGGLNINTGASGSFKLKNVRSNYHALIPEYPLNNYSGTKLAFDFSADSLESKAPQALVKLSSVNFKIDAIDTVSGTPDPSGDINIRIGGLKMMASGNTVDAEKISVNATGALNSSGASSNYTTVSSTTPGDDAIIASRVNHTPLVMVYNGGGILQTIMNLMSLDVNLQVEKARFKTPSYLLPVELLGLDLSTDLNSVKLAVSEVSLSKTSFGMTGVLNGLQPFLTSYSATPLECKTEIDFTNVDINQLSWGYYGSLIARGNDSVFYVPPMTPYVAADSVCVAIPRNIDAEIKLHSQSAQYMGYRFAPLSTDIIVKNGVATLSQLTIGAPYCTAVVDWTYSTKNLSDIFMKLKADVKNFSFSPFYSVFPQLTAKAPELKNFTGTINADINCYFEMFPDMFMNAESLKGNFDVKASEMEFARQGKIEKITHLMLIEGDEPIHIQNMNITGGYHDNILQLNPFRINFDGYQLAVGGVNNTRGDMYYHIALEKSPFHLPFGVTLSGKFKHPDIKLGGTHIDDYKAEMVSSEGGANIDVNIMTYLKHGWLMFIQEAAKYGKE